MKREFGNDGNDYIQLDARYHQSVEDAPAELLYDWKEKAGYYSGFGMKCSPRQSHDKL